MSRFSVAGRSTVAGTALRAMASLFATASVRPRIRKVALYNTTATAVAVSLVRFTNASGVGAGLTEVSYYPGRVPVATGFAGHTGDGAVGAAIRQALLAATVGWVAWEFDDRQGLIIPPGTANGVGLITPTGTGQVCDYYIEWDE